jgi:predicted MPP superfamily phosphohydrolase
MNEPNQSESSQDASRSITWLHLSDLHTCKPKTGWDAHRVLDPLKRDLRRMQDDHGLIPDMIFFTGDLAFGHIGDKAGESIPEQFDDGHVFLEGVRSAFKREIPLENVFLVPGNHDVERDKVDEFQTFWLDNQTKSDEITKLIQQGKIGWVRFMDRLSAFKAFLERHGYSHLLKDPDRLIYAEPRDIKGFKFSIVGLNTAWSCGRVVVTKRLADCGWRVIGRSAN